MISPADSKILKISEITEDSCSIIKGAAYSLGELLSGEQIKYSREQINGLKINSGTKLFQIIFYLAPGDYHRFHAPTKMSVY
jgi:phosphatidylserine decarboxylase